MHCRKIIGLLLSLLIVIGTGIVPMGAWAYDGDTDTRTEEILESMSLHEKVCQMMIMYQSQMPEVSGKVSTTETGEALRASLEKWPVGGILYDASNMKSHTQLTELIEKGQSYSKYPMFTAVDEEGGRVARVGNTLGYLIGDAATIGAMLTFENSGTDVAYKNANIIGQNIISHGLNLDFAPVADVHSNPANPVINTRAYATTFDGAANLIPYAVNGYHDAGVACTLKHYPGHGDTSSDSHTGVTYAEKTVEQIREEELQPFRAGIDAGSDMVMSAHITVREVGVPSVFSEDITMGLLREENGFDGVVITDGLGMQAVTNYYTIEQVCQKAIDSGVDMFCCFANLETAVNYVENAVIDGTLTENRIDESVRRIIKCKLERGIMS